MDYKEVVAYLYAQLPAFQKLGKSAIKPKLTNIKLLCKALGNPQNDFKSIHVAGTNGKGSSSHFIASIAQESGLKVGLYTSPHLKDFRERFKINGIDIPESYIVDFVLNQKLLIDEISPSFFELTVALAFKYFSDEKIDLAIIEVGLGGRFDSTNIISPIISLITNIGYDHQDVLGNTLEEIAFQKAGIIKPNTPVVISETIPETKHIFIKECELQNSKIIFAKENTKIKAVVTNEVNLKIIFDLNGEELQIESGLKGYYQITNIAGVLSLILELNNLGFNFSIKNIKNGFLNVIKNTNLKGRWQILNEKPLTICDTGHNEHALKITTENLKKIEYRQLHLVLGFVKDKDVNKALDLFDKNAKYYFCEFDSFRSLNYTELMETAENHKLDYEIFSNVNQGIAKANTNATENDLIFIGGSTYLIAEINNL